jgi:hypothetical protein
VADEVKPTSKLWSYLLVVVALWAGLFLAWELTDYLFS